ncbi:bacteriocin maturation protein [Mesobacillus campisalis]|uniref:Bacteriocin maturation protein n=1 Tax=Mesobacillus campisalis TaxID=1408103 RepID=A0A0M2SRJ7_9BACI|nr:putative thiazole-containing bacteriocin maturation protein [Mesobacillus campisalis]KKK36296.1 bacteriocin maturation protein [Mesobacillus campisalis]
MSNLKPSMLLKVKRDTFFLPDSNSGVYFRNNISSFHMKGQGIDQWVSKLMPMFDGKHTLEYLTKGLPGPYKNRVYEIAGVLHANGFVRDISSDSPHQLSQHIVEQYESQIEFLESFGDSPAYRFQRYRQTKVLAIGSGSMFVSLVSALLQSGLPRFNMLLTPAMATDTKRIQELVKHARKTDPEASVEELTLKGHSWQEIIQGFDCILYVAPQGNLEELRSLHRACRAERKLFLPAFFHKQRGLAGPIVHPDSDGCWESAWRSLHETVFPDNDSYNNPATAGAMLSNIIVFELFKHLGRAEDAEMVPLFYLLNPETLEGKWQMFLPHPLVAQRPQVHLVKNAEEELKKNLGHNEQGGLILYLSQLASSECGVFRVLAEEELEQLPLSQCRVQVADPLSEGPAKLLPSKVCAELTHEKARKAAGLTGIEMYVDQLLDLLYPSYKGAVGIGAGENIQEAVCRGLQKCLEAELGRQLRNHENAASRLQLAEVEDDCCRFYLQALSTMNGTPDIALGKEVAGFPVFFVRSKERWHPGTGLHPAQALQNALKAAFLNEAAAVRVQLDEHRAPISRVIPALTSEDEILQTAIERLAEVGKRLSLLEFDMGHVLKKEIVKIYGVLLGEEGDL